MPHVSLRLSGTAAFPTSILVDKTPCCHVQEEPFVSTIVNLLYTILVMAVGLITLVFSVPLGERDSPMTTPIRAIGWVFVVGGSIAFWSILILSLFHSLV